MLRNRMTGVICRLFDTARQVLCVGSRGEAIRRARARVNHANASFPATELFFSSVSIDRRLPGSHRNTTVLTLTYDAAQSRD